MTHNLPVFLRKSYPVQLAIEILQPAGKDACLCTTNSQMGNKFKIDQWRENIMILADELNCLRKNIKPKNKRLDEV